MVNLIPSSLTDLWLSINDVKLNSMVFIAKNTFETLYKLKHYLELQTFQSFHSVLMVIEQLFLERQAWHWSLRVAVKVNVAQKRSKQWASRKIPRSHQIKEIRGTNIIIYWKAKHKRTQVWTLIWNHVLGEEII